jgi:class 3 adenylate cyclase
MDYVPKPMDTSTVKLPEALEQLLEQLAQNTHEHWARQRLAEGWVYGEKRDDAKKQHPDLVPYDQLPEGEKAYDRTTAAEALKAILALGYEITPPRTATVHNLRRAQEWKESIGQSAGAELYRRWNERGSLGPYFDGDLYKRFLKRSLDRDEFLLAADIAAEALEKLAPEDSHRLFISQKRALALAQTGAPDEARALLLKLIETGHQDEDTLCGIGRTYKDEWIADTNAEKKKENLRSAYLWYARAYLGLDPATRSLERGDPTAGPLNPIGTYYSGINAATLALFLGFRQLSKKLADLVRQQCEEKLIRPPSGEAYWLEASLAEAYVLLGAETQARQFYRKAAARGEISRRDMLSSTRRQARFLAAHLFDGRANYFDDCFPECSVAIFAGHLIDRPDSSFDRFPPGKVDWVSKAIAERLAHLDASVGFSSAASGSDLLFLEAMLQRRGDINVLLPWPRDYFRATSVEQYPGADWGARFDSILARATTVQEVANFRMPEDDDILSYDYCNHIMMGLAQMRARQLDLKIVPLVVWDGTEEWAGGTGSLVSHWREHGIPVEEIKLPRTEKIHSPGAAPTAKKEPAAARPRQNINISGGRRSIRALLFADVRGYSKLTESEILHFVKHFLRTVSVLMAESLYSPIYNNTWGDAFYFVFNSVRDAGLFSLEFVNLVGGTDWSLYQLPRNLDIRIGLHAGPVYESFDQVTRQITFSGSHVSTTARIEPITEPGKIYTTQEFAALAALENIQEFRCQYVGQKPFAKNFGVRPIYLVKPTPA